MSKVVFVTGVSSGFGKELLIEAAAAGYIAVGTVRKPELVAEIENISKGKTFAYRLDVNHHDVVAKTLQAVVDRFGRLDAVINNAGYGLMGAVEETSMDEARQQMETNFFGALAVTQAAIPHLRRQGSGYIIQFSSVAGLLGTPGVGLYNASKFALEGLSEALRLELAPFNIHVTIVEPGPFRTLWAGPSMKFTQKTIAGYENTAHKTKATITGYSGAQPGDPVKGSRAVLQLLNEEKPPLRLVLGKVALQRARTKLALLQTDFDAWEHVSNAVDYDNE